MNDMTRTEHKKRDGDRCQTELAYDKTFQMYNEKLGGSSAYENRTIEKKKKNHVDGRSSQCSIVQSSQSYGWREPFDNVQLGNARIGHCKRTFMNSGHL